ncbi:polymorphic toxin type 44 domain-containing protein [Ferrovibrio sp.]|uniref:polymorphic toxin type 44 domain-containing protein n=1 Tax=Ferrovibrio sp. TaxID=1917215 RepID=UPI001B7B633F|nr:polymorphic toxin type 44 domain-containing protein [Ferrovibrio sp.]MBP7064884.1 hypothetical protein [Ferrovibrio sp.]
MPYSLPDPLDENALKRMQRDKRYWRDPEMQRAVEEGYRLLYPNYGRDAFGRLIIAAPRRGSLADLRRLAASEQNADNISGSFSGSGPVHVDAYTRNGDEPVRQHFRGSPGGGGGNGYAKQRPPSVSEENWQRYRPIFESGLVDIEANAAEAAKINIFDFFKNVYPKGDWDLKNRREFSELRDAGVFDTDMLQDFGNYHFGYVANAHGLSLGTALAGAGMAQAFLQSGGDRGEALLGFSVGHSSRDNAEAWTRNGFKWGDNPGDADAVMRGWRDAEKRKSPR